MEHLKVKLSYLKKDLMVWTVKEKFPTLVVQSVIGQIIVQVYLLSSKMMWLYMIMKILGLIFLNSFVSLANFRPLANLKVCSASIAAFRILLAISPHFVWISGKNFSFFIFQCFTWKFEYYNLKSYWILTYSILPEGSSTSEVLNKYFIV